MTWAIGLAALAMAAACILVAGRVSSGPGGWRVTGALLRRRVLVLASYKFRLAVMAFNVTLFFVVVFFVARGFLLPALAPSLEGEGRSVLLYVVVGLAAWPTVWTGYQASAATIRGEQNLGTLETTVATPAGLEALPFASFMADGLESLLWATGFLAFAFFLLPIPGGFHPEAMPIALAAIALAAMFLWGIGLIFAALTTYYKELGSAVTVLQYGLIVLSGAYIPLDVLPPWIAWIGQALPLTIAFDLLRESLFSTVDGVDALWRLAELAGASLLMLGIGTRAFARGIDAARRAGVLQGY